MPPTAWTTRTPPPGTPAGAAVPDSVRGAAGDSTWGWSSDAGRNRRRL